MPIGSNILVGIYTGGRCSHSDRNYNRQFSGDQSSDFESGKEFTHGMSFAHRSFMSRESWVMTVDS